jgi:class 3 adenylate cyclase/tetratricopeptide (TPR) repeat protein
MSETTVVTLLFTDLVSSTELGQKLGEVGAESLRRDHVVVLRGPIAGHGGEEVKNVGDGLMVAFGSPSQAVACAVAMQQATERHNRRLEHELGLRIGLHLGEVTKDEGDYFGTPVVVAERLCKAADGGQILVSDAVRLLVGSRAPQEFKAVGEYALKGIDDPIDAFDVFWEPGAEPISLPAALAPQAGAPFVARDAELDKLRELWARAQAGQRQLVLIAGEPGIGKTSLTGEFARSAYDEGATVLFGRCDEETPIPYQPFVEALRQYVTAAPTDELREHAEDRGDLARLVPELAERVPGLSTAEAADPETERHRLFEAVSSFLADVSRHGPLVLVLDDIHWADRPSLLLLRHVVRSHDPAALLVCGTYRETELARTHPLADVLAELRRAPAVERIHLSGLDEPEIVDWLTAAIGHELGRRGLRLVEELHKATEGNPFFLQQVMAHLLETERFIQRDGRWTFEERVEELGIPEGVKEVIGRRLSRQSDECNTVLAHASVLGREFEFDVLARMANLDEDALLTAIEQALASQLIVDARAEGGPRYSFTHALVRETLYDELSVPRKQRLHLRAGQAIEGVHAGEIDHHLAELAVHYRTAGTTVRDDRAVDYSLRAGEAAARLFAFEDAALNWLAALELMEDDAELAERRARLLERVGDLMYVTGIDYAKGIDCLEGALRIYDELGQPERAARVHSRLGRDLSTFLPTMNIPRALEHFRAAEAVLSNAIEGAPLGYLYVGLAAAGMWGLETREGLAASARAMEIGERLGNDALWAEGAALHAWALMSLGRVTEARALVDESWEKADRADHSNAAFLAAWVGVFVESNRWNMSGVRDWTERELAKPRQAQAPVQREQLLRSLGLAFMVMGETSEMRKLATEHGWTRWNHTATLEGNWAEAEAIDAAAREFARARGASFLVAGSTYFLAADVMFQGDLARASALLSEGLEMCVGVITPFELLFASLLARVFAADGRPKDALPHLERCREILAADDAWAGAAPLVDVLAAVVAAAMGQTVEADAFFEKAMDGLRRFPNVWDEADALHLWGGALLNRGERVAAAAKLDAAIEIYRRIGAGQPWIDRVMADRAKL